MGEPRTAGLLGRNLFPPCARLIARVLLLAVAGWSSVAAETLELAVFEYPPMLSEQMPGHGLEPAIVTAAFEQEGIAVRYTFYPPARALQLARLGVADATLGWVRSEERERASLYSNAIIEAPLVFFHLRAVGFDWRDYADLRGLRIGTVNKYHYGAAFHETVDAGVLTTEAATKDALNLKKLVLGRIAATPILLHVGYHLARTELGAEEAALLTHHPRALKTSVHHLLLPRARAASPRLLASFNRGLGKIKDSGEYQRILDAHLKP